MYKITTKDGEEHLTERATWIRVHPSGRAYLLCERNRAEGVAYQGRPYLYKDGNSVAEMDTADVMADEDTRHREEVEQELTEQYLDGIQTQQDITDLQLQLLEG